MSRVKLIDSMRDFLMYWRDYSGRNVEEMFSGWLMRYISSYPELLISEVVYWGDLDSLRARMMEKVLPRLDDLIHGIIEAWMIFLQNIDEVYSMASEKLKLPQTPIIAIYVGSGWKPRWTASVLDRPALFFDLGGIASLKWIDQQNLRGLIAFGLGQFRQVLVRGGAERYAELESNPYFMLYSQGLAQFAEILILGADSWHGAGGRAWLRECEERELELARRYLEGAEAKQIDSFYEPWREVLGLSLVGRYLGYKLISELHEKGLDLNELMSLPEERVISLSKEFLRKLSGK